MAQPLLGDYDCEQVVVTFKGIKNKDLIITPTQFGAEERVSVGERARAEVTEGQGGGAVVSHLHSRIADYTLTLLPTDEANKQFDEAAVTRERFEVTIVDNSSAGGESKVKMIAWLRAWAPYAKGRVAGEITWNFQSWVQDMQHGQATVIGSG
jgi:hypothetical protein